MAFATSTTFNRFCQNTKSSLRPAQTSVITASAFGTLAALGQVPLTGITGTFATYSVLNNGVLVASNQSTSSYTITGLGNNVQIGPITVVPYDAQGKAGTAFTVTGGSGAGRIYTWAQANTPTFSATTLTGTTLACTGTFSKAYVSFSGGTGSPTSGTLINTANNITQAYTGMASSTTYSFNVYPVNGDGIPASATGTNVVTGSVKILPPTLWVACGQGNGNSLAYATNGITWTGLGINVFNYGAQNVAYSSIQNLWVAVGGDGSTQGLNSLAYSTNGFNWTGLGINIFPYARGIANGYSGSQNIWVAGGGGGANFLAYSTDGFNWTGLGKTIFSYSGQDIAYNGNIWVAGGLGLGNCLGYSTNGITWTRQGYNIFSNACMNIKYSTIQDLWVAAGHQTNYLAYSKDGLNWTGLTGIAGFTCIAGFSQGYGVAYSRYQNLWTVTGSGTTSKNGFDWTGLGTAGFRFNITKMAYSESQKLWVLVGSGNNGLGNTLAYSTDLFNWTGKSTTIFSTQGYGVACNN